MFQRLGDELWQHLEYNNKVELVLLYKKAGHLLAELARFCIWDPTAILSGLPLQELVEVSMRAHPASIDPCSNALVWNLAPLQSVAKFPMTSVQPEFLISAELWVLHYYIFPHHCLSCILFYLLCKFGFWMSSWCSSNLSCIFFFLRCTSAVKQHSAMLSVLCYTSSPAKWGEIKVYFSCLVDSSVCIGHLLPTSAESVVYFCSLVLHIASVPQNLMN